jgi:hypothetical protein
VNNSNDPQLPTLGVADRAAMEAFLEEMLLIYPLLGLTAFEVPRTRERSDTMLYLKRKGIVARGYDKDEGFVVLAGSKSVGDKEITSSASDSLVNLRKSLVERGVLVADVDHFKFTQNYTFNSPSQAASVVIGGMSNGLLEWHDDKSRTLKAIQQVAIEGAAEAAQIKSVTSVKPGVLTRKYKGQTHQVRRLAEGFEYEGKVYNSLTKVAKVITGASSISGPKFFQLGKEED